MYSASQAFHTAVANGAHQIALLIFDDAVFTNDDIDVSRGIEFNDYFNTEEDLSIGQALSNEIRFSLFNDHDKLDNYEFGDFTATIGAQIGTDTIDPEGATVVAKSRTHTYTAYSTSPYIRRDSVALSAQPSGPVQSILIYDGIVYCYVDEDTVICYKDSNGALDSEAELNDFMMEQMRKWSGKGISYGQFANDENMKLKIIQGTKMRTYEFVPLGRFNAERPKVPTVIEIDFTCYDLMQRFEKDMPGASELETKHNGFHYPCSIAELLETMCDYVDIPCGTATFINSTAQITAEPDDFSRATMRDVISWIAEASCSNARINRDGELILDWVHSTDLVIDEHGYSEFNPYWYETKGINQLCNRASSGEYDYYRGSSTDVNAYLIQDNPLLKGVE